MMRLLSAFVLLVLQATCSARLSESEEERVAKLYKYVFERVKPKGFDHSRLRELLQEDRELLLRWRRDGVEASRAAGMSEESIESGALDLAILGDEWGIDVIVKRIRQRRGYSDHLCWLVRDPRIIPKIGDLLFREEPFQEADDVVYDPRQLIAASGTIETLRYSPQFQPDLSNWAADLRSKWGHSEEILEILREWYKENEQKLQEGKFQEIRPGRVPVVKATDSREAVKEPRKTDGAGQLPKAAPTPGVSAVAETTGTPAWVLWGSGIFAILLALGMGVRRFLVKR